MSASKRNFQNFLDKSEFNYDIVNGIIIFPILYNIDSKNKLRKWKIYIELYNNNNQINIQEKYIYNNEINELKQIYNNLYIKIYTLSGIHNMKMTLSTPTIINKGKNIKKTNETNILTQGLIYARSKYLKKIDNGYTIQITPSEIKENKINNIYPMALHIYEKNKHKIIYPCYIQPKLDGIRMICYFYNDNIIFKSRKLKNINGFLYIKNELISKIKKYPNIIFDGELYCHGLNLQNISSIVRNEIKSNTTKMLQFHIFDCFDKDNPNWKFIDRMIFVNKITNELLYSISVITDTIYNEEQGNEIYNKYINLGYEGIVYKKIDGLYKFSFNKELRSYDYLKRKQQFDNEFEIIDYTTGDNGKAVGAIVFIMKTKNGKTFHVTPNIPIDEQKQMYEIAKKNFNNVYKGKMATIKYDDLSADGIPLRAKFITIRNYE